VKWLAYAAALLCLLLAVQIVVAGWALLGGAPDALAQSVVSFVQVVMTFVTAVLVAIYNFATTRSNEQYKASLAQENATALAKYQHELGIETERTAGRIRADFTRSVNEANASFQAGITRSTEELKTRLGQTIPQRYNGYHALFRAISKLFFAVRLLEDGAYPAEALKAAFAAADDAAGLSLLVDEADRSMFYRYVTTAHRIAETARGLSDPIAIVEAWEAEGRAFGAAFKEIEAAYATKVRD
jgi:hypothetical protein